MSRLHSGGVVDAARRPTHAVPSGRLYLHVHGAKTDAHNSMYDSSLGNINCSSICVLSGCQTNAKQGCARTQHLLCALLIFSQSERGGDADVQICVLGTFVRLLCGIKMVTSGGQSTARSCFGMPHSRGVPACSATHVSCKTSRWSKHHLHWICLLFGLHQIFLPLH